MKDFDGKCFRAVKKELYAQKHYRTLGAGTVPYRKRHLNAVGNKTKATNVPSISRGELNRSVKC